MTQRPDSPGDLWDEIDRLATLRAGDEMTDVDMARLQSLLGDSDEAVRLYVAHAQESLALPALLQTPSRMPGVENRLDAVCSGGAGGDLRSRAPAPGSPADRAVPLGRLIARPTPISFAVALCVVVASLVGLSLVYLRGEPAAQVADDSPPASRKREAVARITAEHESRYRRRSTAYRVGDLLTAGSVIELDAGVVRLDMEDGAVVLVEGPARFRVDEAGAGTLNEGNLTALVSERAAGFRIDTPAADLVDLGTEFGVRVAENQATLVRVFQGQVQARPKDARGEQRERDERILNAGDSLWIEMSGRSRDVGPSDGQFVRVQRFAIESSYRRWRAYSQELRDDPSLVAYYTFEQPEGDSGTLRNVATRTRGGYDGRLGDGRSPQTSPTWTTGRWPDKRALEFDDRLKQHAVIPGDAALQLDAAGGFTIAAWIRTPDSDVLRNGVIVANRHKDGPIHYRLALLGVSSSSPHGRPCVQFTGGSVMSSSEKIDAAGGRPQHVAGVLDGRTRAVYVNGRRVSLLRNLPIAKSPGVGDVYLGGSPLTSSPLGGTIDEVALFARALSAAEIGRMYMQGRP